MKYIPRLLEGRIRHTIERGKSVLLMGARQTGKTTLARQFKSDLSISFVQPDVRQRYEKAPHLLKGEVEALAPDVKGKRPPRVKKIVHADELIDELLKSEAIAIPEIPAELHEELDGELDEELVEDIDASLQESDEPVPFASPAAKESGTHKKRESKINGH